MFIALGLLILFGLGVLVCQTASCERGCAPDGIDRDFVSGRSWAELTPACFLSRGGRKLDANSIPSKALEFKTILDGPAIRLLCDMRSGNRQLHQSKSFQRLIQSLSFLRMRDCLVEQHVSLSLIRSLNSTRKKGIHRVDSLEWGFVS